jgi:Arc/MetJ-type ribon-helix-helix transcriptional regulator
MPRGNPRKLTTIRLPPELLDAVQQRTDNLTAAVEAGLRLWLASEKRKAARETAARTKDNG